MEQLDKLREAQDQKEEAMKKFAAAKELEAKVMKELKRQETVDAGNMVGVTDGK
ncbi:MAG: hypothetical protein KatS3mg068_0091 [Candidatus Sericytochromatia bacterium]|nr:MAG: hypothetical protein KatS3mg068_0091 [Candidatus Sericytochromatia bacterium]